MVIIPVCYNFTEFMQKEARIVCNPIASPFLINMKTDDTFPKRAKTLNTNTQLEDYNSMTREAEATLFVL